MPMVRLAPRDRGATIALRDTTGTRCLKNQIGIIGKHPHQILRHYNEIDNKDSHLIAPSDFIAGVGLVKDNREGQSADIVTKEESTSYLLLF
jgi:hypothetical protein